MGIINGTTNYILTKMTNEGRAYEEVLKEAQALGYAEADPSADVDGWDCVYKLSILASIAFHARVNIENIYREGISKVSARRHRRRQGTGLHHQAAGHWQKAGRKAAGGARAPHHAAQFPPPIERQRPL